MVSLPIRRGACGKLSFRLLFATENHNVLMLKTLAEFRCPPPTVCAREVSLKLCHRFGKERNWTFRAHTIGLFGTVNIVTTLVETTYTLRALKKCPILVQLFAVPNRGAKHIRAPNRGAK